MAKMDLKTVDSEELNRMLINEIQEIERKGLVDHTFGYLHTLKDVSGASFFMDLVILFLADARVTVNDMMETLKPLDVNFHELGELYVKLKGSASCIGACRLTVACSSLSKAIDKKSRDGCLHAFNCIDREYNILNEQLPNVIKIEQEIVTRLSM